MTYIVFLGNEYNYYDKMLRFFTREKPAILYAVKKVRELSNKELSVDYIYKRFKNLLDKNDKTVDYLNAIVGYDLYYEDGDDVFKFVGIKKLPNGVE